MADTPAPRPAPQFLRFPNGIINIEDIATIVPARADKMNVDAVAKANGVRVWFRSGGSRFLPRETLDSMEARLNGAVY